MNVAQILLTGFATLAVAPVLILFVECVAAWLPVRRRSADHAPGSMVVLIPAHDEEQGIAATVRALVEQAGSAGRVLVVADNCTDATAAAARDAGAQVIERHNQQQRGKGHALAYGVEHLRSSPPDVVIIMDADCHIIPGGLERLANVAMSSGRPAQARYTMRPPPHPSTRDLISALAFLVRNVVRPRGLAALGQPCQLMGTGMAFPWPLIARMQLASSHLVEDVQMGLQAADLGTPPIWCGDVSVISVLPQGDTAAASQRTRWEHGHLRTMCQTAPRLLFKGVARMRLRMIVQAMDMLVPPLSLFILWLVAAMSVTAIGAALGAGLTPLWIATSGLLMLAVSIVISWARFAGDELPARTLLAVPFYVLWKIPIYLRFIVRRQNEWVRTERTAAPLAPGPASNPQTLSARK